MVSHLASGANANRAIPVSSTGQVSRPAKKSMRKLKKEERIATASSNEAALEAIRLEKNRLLMERVRFWIPTAIIGVFILVATFTSTLIETDNSQSLIWWIPVAFLVLALVVGFLDRKSGQPLKRIILALIVGIILLVGFWLMTTILFLANASVDIFAFFAGNVNLGYTGVANAFGSWLGTIGVVGPPLKVIVLIIGALINFALVVAVPTVVLSLIVQGIAYERHPSVRDTLILAVLALAAFLFPIGLSIIGNLGL